MPRSLGNAGMYRLPTPPTALVGGRRISPYPSSSGWGADGDLVGAGGCGKNRLTVAVGGRVRHMDRHSVVWVDLARLVSGQSVASAVAAALGIGEEPRYDRSTHCVDARAASRV
jgi:hypothetical protein